MYYYSLVFDFFVDVLVGLFKCHKMGIVERSLKKYGRKGGYALGGMVGSAAGKMTGTSIGEKLGRRVGHNLGKMAGKMAGKAAGEAFSKLPVIGSMKKGGPIHRTGKYLLHQGEYVLNRKKARKMRLMK